MGLGTTEEGCTRALWLLSGVHLLSSGLKIQPASELVSSGGTRKKGKRCLRWDRPGQKLSVSRLAPNR